MKKLTNEDLKKARETLLDLPFMICDAIDDKKNSYEYYISIQVKDIKKWLEGESLLSSRLGDGSLTETYTNGKQVVTYKDPDGQVCKMPMELRHEDREHHLQSTLEFLLGEIMDIQERLGIDDD